LGEHTISRQVMVCGCHMLRGVGVMGLDRENDLERMNATLVHALTDARNELERMNRAPNSCGTYLWQGEEDELAVISLNGQKKQVSVSTTIDPSALTTGVDVIINEVGTIIGIMPPDGRGILGTVAGTLPDGRVRVSDGKEEETVVYPVAWLREPLSTGDTVLIDSHLGILYELVERDKTADLMLEEIPDITYAHIGGLAEQIEKIRDAIELPYLHPDLYAKMQLRAPKGVLLYGPPGCGKTLVAKAVANSLAKQAGGEEARAFFINIKGPELLSKWVGETESKIRAIFTKAKAKANEGMPVIIFFDEMDSLFRTRGSGISSDTENTIVPQILAEIDGVEGISNVIVVGSTNREDLIDPGLLRPGRLDIKIKVDRPDLAGAIDIFKKYLTSDLPIKGSVATLITAVANEMFSEAEENKFLEVTYVNGDRETLYFKDFASGAMIENIVSRAKKMAVKAALAGGKLQLTSQHLTEAVKEEYAENSDLPNTTNPDDWAKVSGKKGERISSVRALLKKDGVKNVETVSTGQYL
jgi:proteasome-associated ATPase